MSRFPGAILRHKYFLRGFIKKAVMALPAARRRRDSLRIARRISALPAFRRARTVALYLSLAHEVDTAPLIVLCRRARKRVAVPVVFPETRRVLFVDLPQGRARWTKNVHGIPEPREEDRRYLRPRDLDLLIVPGRAFTTRGRRLGAGGGYYDRFLRRRRVPALGVAYDVQVRPRLPWSSLDRPVDAVVTPARVYRARLT